MSGDFFVQDVNILLFVISGGGLALLMTGCFIYSKLKQMHSKAQVNVPPKTKGRLKKFLKRGSSASDQIQDEMRRENAAAVSNEEDCDNPGFTSVCEISNESPSQNPPRKFRSKSLDFP